MELILHIIGLCPDHYNHLDILDTLAVLSLSDLIWSAKLAYSIFLIKVNHILKSWLN